VSLQHTQAKGQPRLESALSSYCRDYLPVYLAGDSALGLHASHLLYRMVLRRGHVHVIIVINHCRVMRIQVHCCIKLRRRSAAGTRTVSILDLWLHQFSISGKDSTVLIIYAWAPNCDLRCLFISKRRRANKTVSKSRRRWHG
jgi:hypothetical protein